ncbi:MAG: hypothetical protein AABZ60_07425 [Planctomycetota bacterium]
MTQPTHRLLSPLQMTLAVIGILAGLSVFWIGITKFPERIWLNFLMNNFYFLSISMIGAVFIAIHYLGSSAWLTVLRRVPEAMTAYLPVGAVLMLFLLFGTHSLYHWSHTEAVAQDAILQQKSAFLNTTGYTIRMILFLVLWIVLVRQLVKNSCEQDKNGALAYTQKNTRLSAIFLILFALTFTLASIEWIMSLDPHWYSTIFPWYVFSSVLAGGTALMIFLLLMIQKKGYLKEANEYHLHDLGKYLFAFSFFWGYLWYSQYMLIWYSNIPEEVHYFTQREHQGWYILFLLNPLINLVLPFCFLLPAAAKKKTVHLMRVCLFVVAGHWFDFYLMVMPSGMKEGPQFGWIEVFMGLGFFSLFLILVHRKFQKMEMAPTKDPYYEESLHFHGV